MDGLKDNLKRLQNVAELFANFEGEEQQAIENFLLIAAVQKEDKDNVVLNFLRNATLEQKEEVLQLIQEFKEKQSTENKQDKDNEISLTINIKI